MIRYLKKITKIKKKMNERITIPIKSEKNAAVKSNLHPTTVFTAHYY